MIADISKDPEKKKNQESINTIKIKVSKSQKITIISITILI